MFVDLSFGWETDPSVLLLIGHPLLFLLYRICYLAVRHAFPQMTKLVTTHIKPIPASHLYSGTPYWAMFIWKPSPLTTTQQSTDELTRKLVKGHIMKVTICFGLTGIVVCSLTYVYDMLMG